MSYEYELRSSFTGIKWLAVMEDEEEVVGMEKTEITVQLEPLQRPE